MKYLAHMVKDEKGNIIREQTVKEHCRNTAKLAAEKLKVMGLENAGYLVGLIHDRGKLSDEFQAYINSDDKSQKGKVTHTFAGGRLILEKYHGLSGEDAFVSEVISYGIFAHHGLFDCLSPDGDFDGFTHRMTKDIPYEQVKSRVYEELIDEKELDRLYEKAKREITAVAVKIDSVTDDYIKSLGQIKDKRDKKFGKFCYGFLTRIILSAVIDGDRTDTASFMEGFEITPNEATAEMWQNHYNRVSEKVAKFKADTDINKARKEISDACCRALLTGDRLYKLVVPTGGGKTLASLRAALGRAAKFNKSRIIFVTPLLTILDQNAKVIREYINDDSIILEHHSNVIKEEKEEGEKITYADLLTENWDSPIIITTMVQFLNTLFEGRTSCIRRMSGLANSVIVIDEYQTVPIKMLSMFNGAINFLSKICGATVVLCSATPPALENADRPLLPAKDIIENADELFAVFKRTEITDIKDSMTETELAQMAAEKAADWGSVLIICNKKKQALDLYNLLKENGNVYHLSTAMCPEHRLKVIGEIKEKLGREKVICVATQLVEAGVDFSFGCVIRLKAGLDNLIQSAGRCNRNGEKNKICPVYAVDLKGENLGKLKEIKQAKEAYNATGSEFGKELESRRAVKSYYGNLYTSIYSKQGDQDYTVDVNGNSDSLYCLLSTNSHSKTRMKAKYGKSLQLEKQKFFQSFDTAGKEFKALDNNTTAVIVPYGKGKEIIAHLQSRSIKYDFKRQKELLKEAKPYTISMYDYEINGLAKEGGIMPLLDGEAIGIIDNFYSDKFGVDISGLSFDNDNFLIY